MHCFVMESLALCNNARMKADNDLIRDSLVVLFIRQKMGHIVFSMKQYGPVFVLSIRQSMRFSCMGCSGMAGRSFHNALPTPV